MTETNRGIRSYFEGERSRPPTTTGSAGNDKIQGSAQSPPFTVTLPMSSCAFYSLENVTVSNTMLPMGQSDVTSNVHLKKVESPPVNAVLAVVHPSSIDKYALSGSQSDLYKSGVSGFVLVKHLGENNGDDKVTLVKNVMGTLPSETFLLSGMNEITWVEGT